MSRSRICIAWIVALAFAPFAADAATKISDPAKFVSDVYAHIQKSGDYQPPTDIYTPRLSALFALDTKEAGGEVGRIDFDFWTNSQDPQVSDVHVRGQPVENAPSREMVVASFKQGPYPNEIQFYFEKTAKGWQLDDAQSFKGSEQPWTLSVILKYGWKDAK